MLALLIFYYAVRYPLDSLLINNFWDYPRFDLTKSIYYNIENPSKELLDTSRIGNYFNNNFNESISFIENPLSYENRENVFGWISELISSSAEFYLSYSPEILVISLDSSTIRANC